LQFNVTKCHISQCSE